MALYLITMSLTGRGMRWVRDFIIILLSCSTTNFFSASLLTILSVGISITRLPEVTRCLCNLLFLLMRIDFVVGLFHISVPRK